MNTGLSSLAPTGYLQATAYNVAGEVPTRYLYGVGQPTLQVVTPLQTARANLTSLTSPHITLDLSHTLTSMQSLPMWKHRTILTIAASRKQSPTNMDRIADPRAAEVAPPLGPLPRLGPLRLRQLSSPE